MKQLARKQTPEETVTDAQCSEGRDGGNRSLRARFLHAGGACEDYRMSTAWRLRIEVVIVLGLTLGASAVYSIVSLAAKLTEERALGDQSVALNPSRSSREWLDFTYQFLDVFFGLFARRPGALPAVGARPQPVPADRARLHPTRSRRGIRPAARRRDRRARTRALRGRPGARPHRRGADLTGGLVLVDGADPRVPRAGGGADRGGHRRRLPLHAVRRTRGRALGHDPLERGAAWQLPPLPGVRAVLRERRDGHRVRLVLRAMGSHDAARHRALDHRRRVVRRLPAGGRLVARALRAARPEP